MVGHVALAAEKGRRPRLEREELLGQPLLRVAVPLPPGLRERTARRRVDQAAWLLADGGVRRVLAAPDFPWWDVLKEEGLSGVDAAPLVQSMAAPLVLAELARRGVAPAAATVALRGARVSRALFEAAEALCAAVRALVISAPGGEELRGYLRREYGVPVLEDAPGVRSDAAVHFSPGLPHGGALELSGPAFDLRGLELRPRELVLPPELEALSFLALLREEGRLAAGQLVVSPA